ncbi:hypothetical protein OWV82_021912 [Melia azedarach]|uniref:Uncharacterized protein n=1 Tax=Melia azedarach TaxID=155640 RepID=A0ACC1X231_MELAZ|nr:hypothetical protein OWV82_021912 [Melia azedarach]
MGEFGSSVHRSGGSICSGGGETRCSAVWSAHLFWVQRAIGSNPITLMWYLRGRSAKPRSLSVVRKAGEQRTL